MCYEIILKDGAIDSDADWMNLAVRYKAPDGEKSKLEEYSFSRKEYTDSPDHNFKFVCAIVKLAMILHESDYANDISIKDITKDLSEIKLDDEYKLQFKDLVGKLVKG